MAQVTLLKTWINEQLTHPDLNAAFQALLAGINSITGDQIVNGTITLDKFADNANPFQFLGEILCREAVPFGYQFVGSAGLVADIGPGRAYVLNDSDTSIPKSLVLVEKLVNSSVNLTASADNYIDLTINGTFIVLPVAVNGTAPNVTADAVRLMVITTDGTSVIDNQFLADTDIFPPSAASARPDNVYIISHDVEWETQIICPTGLVLDSTGTFSMQISSTQTFDITDSGKNGLEVGLTEEAELLYYLYFIGDSNGANQTALMASDKVESPSLPPGYNIFRRISSFYNDTYSDIMPFYQYNDRYHHMNFGHLVVGESPTMVAGSVAGTTVQAFADVDIADFVPPSAKQAVINSWMRMDGSGSRNITIVAGVPNYIGNPVLDSAYAVSGVQGQNPDTMVPWIHGKPLCTVGGGTLQNDQTHSLEDVPCLGLDGPTLTYGLFGNTSVAPGASLNIALRVAGYIDSFVDDDRDT